MKLLSIKVFLAMLFISCLTACADETDKEAVEPEAAPDAAYDTVVARVQDVTNMLRLNGELKPFETSTIISKVNGYVRNVSAEVGQQVSEGHTLAVIDAPEMPAQLALANNEARMAISKAEASKANYNRLIAASPATSNKIQEARIQMIADLEAARDALTLRRTYSVAGKYLHVNAPFRGLVTAKEVNTGDSIDNKGKMLFQIEDHHKLKLKVSVPEAYASAALKDNESSFTVPAFGGSAFTAKLIARSLAVNGTQRSEIWEFEVLNADRKLKAGTIAAMQLNLQKPGESILLPNSAFVTTQERTYVIRVKDGMAEWVDVKKGFTLENETEALGAIQAGDVIIKTATQEIKDGSTIAFKATAGQER